MRRRTNLARFAALACVIACASIISREGRAQGYPDRPITYIVPSSPGSSPDVVGRIMASALAKALGQSVVVTNRAGAGGTVGAAVAATAAPDGYTILQANSNHSVSHSLYKSLSYDLTKDFSPVMRFASAFYVVLINPSVGVQTLDELIQKAKSQPGKLNYASAGVGAATFIVMEVLKSQAGIDLVHIPYNGGGPALNSVLAGETQVYGSPYGTAKPFLEDGKLVGLAVTAAERIPHLPNYPAVGETLPSYEVTTWYGMMVPAGTPQAVRDKLHAAAIEASNTPEMKKRLEDLGYVPLRDKPEEFAAFLKRDIERMAKVVRDNNLKPE